MKIGQKWKQGYNFIVKINHIYKHTLMNPGHISEYYIFFNFTKN